MDDWDFLDEVDAIQKWPADQKSAVFESKKWSERKAGLEALNTLIEQNPRLSTSTMVIYGELMDEIRKILDRESNIVVVCTAARTVELLAKGLRTKFAGFVGMVFPFLIKRAKDKKKNVRDAVSSSLEAVSETTTAERIQKDVLDWFAIPSPESKQTLLEFIYRYFVKMEKISDLGFVKAIVGLVVKCATDSDVNVREKACMALGSLRRLMADALSQFLAPITTDTAKMEKIAQYEQQAREEFEKLQATKPKRCAVDESGGENTAGNTPGEQTQSTAASDGIDGWEMLEAEDVVKKLEKNLEALLVDKNWKERLAGCEAVKKEVDAVGRIEISERLREIVVILIRIIEKDVNVNVAACSANVLTGIAIKARFAFSSLANKSFPISFDKLKDKKALLRDALNEYIDAASTTTPLSAYCEAVQGGLTSKNPQTRQQTALFLARYFAKQDEKTMDIESLKSLVDVINKASNDADKEVREATLRIIAAIRKSIGEPPARRMFADVFDDAAKSEKIPKIVEELVEQFGNGSSVEMRRLAKQYGVAKEVVAKKPVASKPATSSSTVNRIASRPATPSSTVNRTASRPATPSSTVNRPASRPATSSSTVNRPASRPVSAKPAPPPSRPVQPVKPVATTRPAVSTARPASAAKPVARKPLTTVVTQPPKPFVARPAPSFCNKPPSRPTTSGVRAPSPMNKGVRAPSPGSSLIKPPPSRSFPITTTTTNGLPSKIRPPSRSRLPAPSQ